jgi:hypothetical protein
MSAHDDRWKGSTSIAIAMQGIGALDPELDKPSDSPEKPSANAIDSLNILSSS